MELMVFLLQKCVCVEYHIDLDHSSKVLRVNIPRSDEDRLKLMELMVFLLQKCVCVEYHIDLDHSSKVLSMQEDDSEVQEVVEVVTTAKLITEVVTAAASQVSAASITISAASATISAAAPTVVAAYTRRRKGVVIRDPEEELSLKTPVETPKDQIELDAEYARKLHEEINRDEFNKDIDWDAAMDHVNQKSNNP
nr:hypothetical protein [Tanacetum cinerariifolium]